MTGVSDGWRDLDTYKDRCESQFMRTPDFYGRAVVPQIARAEIVCNPTAALAAYTNQESYLNARYNTRLRGRCDDHDEAPPERYMTPLIYQWQQPDYRPWMATHLSRNDILDCRFYGYDNWKPHVVIKPPRGAWSKESMYKPVGDDCIGC